MDRASAGGPSSFQPCYDNEHGHPLSARCISCAAVRREMSEGLLGSRVDRLPYTHNIGVLLELCAKTASWIPKVNDAATLSSYAITARYPGGADRVTKREAVVTISIAERVLKTVTADLKAKKFL